MVESNGVKKLKDKIKTLEEKVLDLEKRNREADEYYRGFIGGTGLI